MDKVTVFTCGAPRIDCETPGCHERAITACAFELGGRKAGQTCGRRMCEGCMVVFATRGMCAPHARLLAKRAEKAG
jgi:hypothetical protein